MSAVRCREGENDRDRIAVRGTVYGIPARLKQLSESYFVMFNRKTQKFEIHDAAQPDTTLACELPWDELDARAIDYVRERHVSRLDQMAEEIDRYNDKLEQDAEKSMLDKAGYRMKNAMDYMRRHVSADALPRELKEDDA